MKLAEKQVRYPVAGADGRKREGGQKDGNWSEASAVCVPLEAYLGPDEI